MNATEEGQKDELQFIIRFLLFYKEAVSKSSTLSMIFVLEILSVYLDLRLNTVFHPLTILESSKQFKKILFVTILKYRSSACMLCNLSDEKRIFEVNELFLTKILRLITVLKKFAFMLFREIHNFLL